MKQALIVVYGYITLQSYSIESWFETGFNEIKDAYEPRTI